MSRPELWLVCGPAGAGKTSLIDTTLRPRLPVVTAPSQTASLPLADPQYASKHAAALSASAVAEFAKVGQTFAYESRLADDAFTLVADMRHASYEIVLAFVGLDSPELSLMRSLDAGQRPEPATHHASYKATLGRFRRALSLCDRAFIFDNSTDRRRLIMTHSPRETRYAVRSLPLWLCSAMSPFDMSLDS